MVRVFHLFCKLNSYKFSDKVLFDTFMSKTDLIHQCCPCCGSCSNHVFYSYYERNMISFSDGVRHDYTVAIPRIKCHCGHTHAVLPDVLIPYGSYSIRFILRVLCNYLARHCTVQELCSKYQIAISTLYTWIHLFLEHFNILAGILESVDSLSLSAIDRINSYVGLTREFYIRFSFSFLQHHHITTPSNTA